jgi:hypothetical protein
MSRSIHECDVAHRSRAQRIAEEVRDRGVNGSANTRLQTSTSCAAGEASCHALAHETVIDEEGAAADAAIAPRMRIDYGRIMAETGPDQPGGRIVFSTADYETEEEADVAFEAFIDRIVEAPYEEG